MRRYHSLIFAILGIFLSSLSMTTSFAHAELQSSDPIDGSVVTVIPAVITLTFGEELIVLEEEKVNSFTLTNSNGVEILLTETSVDGAVLSGAVDLDSAELIPGNYLVSYRVVSADGHPINGDITFEFAPQELVAQSEETPVAIAEEAEEAAQTPSEPSAFNIGLIGLFIIVAVLVGALLLAKRKR